MLEIEKAERCRLCFNCKEYVLIFPDNPDSMMVINVFDSRHIYHMVQTVNLKEVDKNIYKLKQ